RRHLDPGEAGLGQAIGHLDLVLGRHERPETLDAVSRADLAHGDPCWQAHAASPCISAPRDCTGHDGSGPSFSMGRRMLRSAHPAVVLSCSRMALAEISRRWHRIIIT